MRLRSLFMLTLFVASIESMSAGNQPRQLTQIERQNAETTFRGRYGQGWSIAWDSSLAAVKSMNGSFRSGRSPVTKNEAGIQAGEFLRGLGDLLGVSPDNLEIAEVNHDPALGRYKIRFRQIYDRVEVEGARIVVSIKTNGEIYLIRNSTVPLSGVRIAVAISEKEAIKRAYEISGKPFAASDSVGPTLAILPPSPHTGVKNPTVVYKVRLGPTTFYIDSQTGALVWQVNNFRQEVESPSESARASVTYSGTIRGPVVPLTNPGGSVTLQSLEGVRIYLDYDPFNFLTYGIDGVSGATGAYSIVQSAAAMNFRTLLESDKTVVHNYNSIDSDLGILHEYAEGETIFNFDFPESPGMDVNIYSNINSHINWLRQTYSGTTLARLPAYADAPSSAFPSSATNAACDGTSVRYRPLSGAYSHTIRHEVSHYFVYNVNGQEWLTPSNQSLECMDEAFAWYYPAAAMNDPSVQNPGDVADISSGVMVNGSTEADHADYFNQKAVAAAWWSLRSSLGINQTNSLLFTALDNVNSSEVTPRDMFNELLVADDNDTDPSNLTPHLGQIDQAYADHGMFYYPKVTACDENGTAKTTFNFGDPVFVKLSRCPTNESVTISAVGHKATWTNAQGISPLVAGSISVTIDAAGNSGVIMALTGSELTAPGQLDIIVDVDNNSKYDFDFVGKIDGKTTATVNPPTAAISSVTLDKSSYQPSASAIFTVSLAKSLTGATVTYKLNGTDYSCSEIGNGVYRATIVAPAQAGTYSLAVTAKKTGYLDGTGSASLVVVAAPTNKAHDYAITAIAVSPQTPVVNDLVTVTATLQNVGLNSEAQAQLVKFFVDDVEKSVTSSIPALSPNQTVNLSFSWIALQGAHNLKIQSYLSGDLDATNDYKVAPVNIGTAGNLLVDGSSAPIRNLTLNPGTSAATTLQVQNNGSASITCAISRTGAQSSWVSLTGGTSLTLAAGTTQTYDFAIVVPSGTAMGDYSASIVFSYEGGSKQVTVLLPIRVMQFANGLYENTLQASAATINGNYTTVQIKMFPPSVPFQLDANPSTSYNAFETLTATLSLDEFNRLNEAQWFITANPVLVTGGSNLRLSIEPKAVAKTFTSSLNQYREDVLSWFQSGSNTVKIALNNYGSGDAVQWNIYDTRLTLSFTTAAWGGNFSVSQSTLDGWKAGFDYARIYFNVDAVTTAGDVALYNASAETGSTTISSSDVGKIKYLNIPKSTLLASNNFVIRALAPNHTVISISNIKLVVHYFTGDPALAVTKSVDLATPQINQDVTVSALYSNVGSNIAKNLSYNDSPLPSGLTLTGGSLSGSLTTLRPGENTTGIYGVRASDVGVYTFGGTAVTFKDPSNTTYSTTSNSVSFTVSGGTLLVSGGVDTSPFAMGDTLHIHAGVTGSILSNAITDAVVRCTVKRPDNSTSSFNLMFNGTTQRYEGLYANTQTPGSYTLDITAQKGFYTNGQLSPSLAVDVINTAVPPVISGVAGAPVNKAEAMVSASINPSGYATSYTIRYGLSTSYGSTTDPVPVGSDALSHSIQRNFTELSAGMTYHFQLVAENAGGVAFSADIPVVLPGSMIVSKPLAGTMWVAGTQQSVEWTAAGLQGNVNIHLSTDGGATFLPAPLASNTPNDGAEQVTVPVNYSSRCRIRVQAADDPTISGLNPGDFIIFDGVLKPDLVFTSFKTYDAGPGTLEYAYTLKNVGTKTVFGDSLARTMVVQALYSPDTLYAHGSAGAGGMTFLNPGSHLDPGDSIAMRYPVGNPLSPAAPYVVIRVDRDTVVAESDESNNDAWARSLELVSLTDGNAYDFSTRTRSQYIGGEFYIIVNAQAPMFYANNIGQRGLMDLGDIGIQPLADLIPPASGYFQYGVPVIQGHTYVSLGHLGGHFDHVVFRVKTVTADTVKIVTISSPVRNAITVTTPSAWTRWVGNRTGTVTWSAPTLSGNVNIRLSTDAGATYPTLLAANTSNDGSETVVVPNTPATYCRIRVESASDMLSYGESPIYLVILKAWDIPDNAFTRLNFQYVYQPNGSTSFASGTTQGEASVSGIRNNPSMNQDVCGFNFASQSVGGLVSDFYFYSTVDYPNQMFANNGWGGIHDFGAVDYGGLTSIPSKNEAFYYSGETAAIPGHVYGILTRDSSHYAKILVTGIDTVVQQVTFSVRMNVKMRESAFIPAAGDLVWVRGSFNSWATTDTLTDTDGDSVYTKTIFVSPGSIEYKFYKTLRRNLSWEGTVNPENPNYGNRTYSITPGSQSLPAVFFDNDSVTSPAWSGGDLREGISDAVAYAAVGTNWTTKIYNYGQASGGWVDSVGSWGEFIADSATSGGVKKPCIRAHTDGTPSGPAATVADYRVYSPTNLTLFYGLQDGRSTSMSMVRFVVQLHDSVSTVTLLDSTLANLSGWRALVTPVIGFTRRWATLRLITDPVGATQEDWARWGEPYVFSDTSGNAPWIDTIRVADNCGNVRTLRFGQIRGATDGIDAILGEEELPPPPPAGVLHARFITGADALPTRVDFRSDSASAVVWRINFQAGSCGYPVTLRWNRMLLPEGDVRLVDPYTGSLVNLDMKADSECVISNAGITALSIQYTRGNCRQVSVASGWNLISVPVVMGDMNVATTFPGATSQAFRFEGGYAPVSALAIGKGYWLKFGGAGSYIFCGDTSAARDIAVRSGWNIIGPFNSPVAVSSITSEPPGIVTNSSYGFAAGYVVATTFMPGSGYWVKSNANGVLHLGGGIAKESSQGITVADGWPKITIRNGSGGGTTLYLAPRSELMDGFELPPLPPAGTFDARFSTSAMVDTLESNRHEIVLQSVAAPLRIVAANLKGQTLRLMHSGGGTGAALALLEDKEILLQGSPEKLIIESRFGAGEIPTEFSLSQNYPNPFNPSTTIRFGLPVSVHTRITFYDILGRVVATPVDADLDAGYHEFSFDASSLASGTYFYRIETGGFVKVLKMMLIR